jgi:hypothetical protein
MKRALVGLGGAGVVALAFGLWFFEPWRFFTSSEIDEAVPTVSAPTTSATGPAAPSSASAGPREISSGRFVDGEHDTTGTARILELSDGRRFVRLEDFATSDGPDVHVWLSDASAGGSWGRYDDGQHLRLGELKATNGNQNYAIPASARLTGMRSVVIWCDRFNVAFGSAPVRLVS